MIFGMDFRENPIAIIDDQTTPTQFDTGIPKFAIALFTFIMVGADNSFTGTGFGRYQFVIDSDMVIDMTPSETAALFEYIYSRMGGQVPATDALIWDWPFYLLGMLAPLLDGGNYPEVGFPSGSDKVIRFQAGSDADAGSALIGWKKSTREPSHSPLMLGRVISGLTDTSPDQRYEINWQPVPTVGMIINGFAHFVRFRLFAADAKGETREVADVLHDHVLQVLDPYNVQSITDPLFIPFDMPTVFAKGSYILFETASSYDGTERLVPVQLVPEKKAA